MSFIKSPGSLPGVRAMSAVALKVELRERIVPDALRPVPVKRAAQLLELTPRAVEGLRQGEHGPSGVTLIMLARQFPCVRAWLRRAIGDEHPDTSPEAARIMAEIQTILARRT